MSIFRETTWYAWCLRADGTRHAESVGSSLVCADNYSDLQGVGVRGSAVLGQSQPQFVTRHRSAAKSPAQRCADERQVVPTVS